MPINRDDELRRLRADKARLYRRITALGQALILCLIAMTIALGWIVFHK